MKLFHGLCILVVLPYVFGGGKDHKRNDLMNLLRRLKQPHARMTNENLTATTEFPDGSNVPTEPPPTSNYISLINGTYEEGGPDFTCDNGEVTYSAYVCDGDNDCGDCTDEPADLCDTPCTPGQWNHDSTNGYTEDADFTCDNGEVTYSAYVCDGDNDCGDCTDEPADLCDTPCTPGQWNHDDLLCDNGNGPFPSSYACDGWNDCGDCSDEVCDQHTAACQGTQEGENFAGSGGYLRKRAKLVKIKEKRDNMKLVKTRESIAVKKENEEPSVNQKRTIQIGWNLLNGRLIRVALGHVGDVLSVWGVNAGNNIYYRRVNNGWEQIPGQLSDISVGFNEIWGVNSNDLIYRRTGITESNPKGTGWQQIPGRLVQVSVSAVGRNPDVWGVNRQDNIYHCKADDHTWQHINGALKVVSVGEAGVWGVNRNDEIYYRTGTYNNVENNVGTGWQNVAGSLKWISSGEDIVWGVNSHDQIYYRTGISSSNPTGTGWVQVPGYLTQIDSFKGIVFGVNSQDAIYYSL